MKKKRKTWEEVVVVLLKVLFWLEEDHGKSQDS
jgi:hypothetical protein